MAWFATLVTVWVMVAAAPARAQVRADSTGAMARDSARIETSGTAPDTAAARDSIRAPAPVRQFGSGLARTRRTAADSTARKPSRFEEPRWMMLRSLVVPGWGQWANGSWLKAVGVAAGEVALGLGIAGDLEKLDRLQQEIDAARTAHDAEAEVIAVTAYNDRQATLVGRQWLLGGLIVYAVTDAYVDAHFRRFKVEFERDPALPEGTPVPKGGRVSLRWTF